MRMAYVAVGILYLFLICIAFVTASYGFASDNLIVAVVITALVAVALFIVQVYVWAQKREKDEGGGFWCKLKSYWTGHNSDIVVVGVATHYSALMIGVSSFGKVVLDYPIPNMTIMIVVIQQVLLNYAAVILVNAFRKARIGKS